MRAAGRARLAAEASLAVEDEASVPPRALVKSESQTPQRVELYVRQAGHLAERARVSLEALESAGCAEATRSEIMTYVDLVEGLAGQVRRRVLEGETIPQEENVFSIFTPHTRWCAKGKAHPAVESAINNLECRGLDRIREQGPRASSAWCGWGCWQRTCTGSDVWYGMGSAIACGAMDVAEQPQTSLHGVL